MLLLCCVQVPRCCYTETWPQRLVHSSVCPGCLPTWRTRAFAPAHIHPAGIERYAPCTSVVLFPRSMGCEGIHEGRTSGFVVSSASSVLDWLHQVCSPVRAVNSAVRCRSSVDPWLHLKIKGSVLWPDLKSFSLIEKTGLPEVLWRLVCFSTLTEGLRVLDQFFSGVPSGHSVQYPVCRWKMSGGV
jgi:hypothetical protein